MSSGLSTRSTADFTGPDLRYFDLHLLSEGSIISGSRVVDSIIGIRAVVRAGSVVERTVIMGANHFERLAETSPEIPLGIGRDCHIRNAIVDFNARIGDGSKLVNVQGLQHADAENYCIRGGIIVVPKNAVIPPGTVV